MLDRLLELPNSQQVDLAWVRAELWQECKEFRVVPDSLVLGMQVLCLVNPSVLRWTAGEHVGAGAAGR